MAIRFGPIKCVETAPSPAAEDSLLLLKDGGELRIATFTELGLAPVVASVFDLPTTDGTADQVMTTDGSDTLTWDDRMMVKEFLFTEAAGGAGQTYSAAVVVPAGAWILDVIVFGQAVWDDTSGAAGNVGTSTPDDANGYFKDLDMKATDLEAGEYLRSSDTGSWGEAADYGVYLTTAGVNYMWLGTTRTVTMSVVTTDGDGTAGRTRFLVKYMVPSTTTAATQAAT